METSLLYQLHRDGASLRQLSRESGLAVGTIRRRFARAGYSARPRSEATAAANVARKGEKRSEKTAYEYVRDLRLRKREIIRKWKEDRGCQRCPEAHPATLDLHHVDASTKHPRLKRKNASTSRRTGGYFWRDLSYDDLAAELAKCVVLCANCHRILEWEARQGTT